MTIVEAICKALTDINSPATYENIYEHIVLHKYYQFGAEDPLSVVRVKLRVHSNNSNIKSAVNQKKYFSSISGKGKEELFVLLDNPIEPDRKVHNEIEKRNERTINPFVNFFTQLKSIPKIRRPEVHKIASIECFWMLLGAFLPIMSDSLMRVILLDSTFIKAFSDNVKGGEVFLLTSALITPFYFLLYRYVNSDMDFKKENKLPFFGLILPLTLISSLAGLFAFSYYRIGLIIKSQYSESPATGLFNFEFGLWAWLIYLVSLAIWYYSSYMSHLGSGEYKKIRAEQLEKLSSEYEQVRGIQ